MRGEPLHLSLLGSIVQVDQLWSSTRESSSVYLPTPNHWLILYSVRVYFFLYYSHSDTVSFFLIIVSFSVVDKILMSPSS